MSGSYGVVEGQFDDVDDEVYDLYLCQMYILIFRVILNSFIQKSYLCQWYIFICCAICAIFSFDVSYACPLFKYICVYTCIKQMCYCTLQSFICYNLFMFIDVILQKMSFTRLV